MKFTHKIASLSLVATLFFSLVSAQTSKYKCMLQMSNYMGEGAYIAVSLLSPKGEYEKTLYVMGENKKWYNSLKEWYAFYNSSKSNNISAKTGASVTGGDRNMTTLEIDDSKIDKGYSLRFESSVEDQKYHANDVTIPLTSKSIGDKVDGTGYIRYVRLSKI